MRLVQSASARSSLAASSRILSLAAAAALTMALLGGCATRTASNPLSGGAPLGESLELELQVTNQNFNQITVFTARGSTYRRLGTVSGNASRTFTLEWPLPNIQLRVKFLAGPDFVTESLSVAPGEILELIVPTR